MSQRFQLESAKYCAARALEGGRTMAVKLASLPSKIQHLPEWGFPENAGFSMMPPCLYQHACQLATDFVGLVVQSMSIALWDSCFWSVHPPSCFAALIHWYDVSLLIAGPGPAEKTEPSSAKTGPSPEKKPGPSPAKTGPSPEEKPGPSPQDMTKRQQLMKHLHELRERWNGIFIVEKLLFTAKPIDSSNVQKQFMESQNEYQELAKLYLFLDGVSNQLTRKIIAILSNYYWDVKALGDRILQARLRDTFAVPASTKS